MSRILFVTVGTSAAENEEIKEHNQKLKDRLGDDDARKLIAEMEEQGEDLAPLKAVLLNAHREFWEARDAYRKEPANFRLTSAETISTFMSLGALERGVDKAVLLNSDTAMGRMCGEINEILFRDYLFAAGKAGKDDVILEEIEGLNPRERDSKPFSVYPQVRAIVDRYAMGNKSQPLFNITGGYKGLIPPITHLAWTRYEKRSPRILYMHDSMRATVTVLKPAQDGQEMRENNEPVGRTTAFVDLS
jgi:CRISPR/Cas system-associated protein Csm6